MFFLITLVIILPIFLFFGVISGVLTNKTINNRIGKLLKKHNYILISIANTNKTFKYDKGSDKLSWKNFTVMGYSTARTIMFKEVAFKTPDNKTVSSLVAVDSVFRIYHKVFFEVDLNTLQKTRLD